MPVPTSISELSTTAGSNPPSGSDSPTVTDDHFRAAYSFIKELSDDKAEDDDVVKLTGDQTIAGVKTFSSTIAANISGNAAGLSATLAQASGGTGVTDGSNLAQPGDIKATARSTAPAGWEALPLTPTNVARVGVYAPLFAAIGTTWGVGDGSTTFGFPYMPANYAAVQSNGNVGTATTGDVKAHTHPIPPVGGGVSVTTGPNATAVEATAGINSGSTGGSANLAAGIRFLWCVKL